MSRNRAIKKHNESYYRFLLLMGSIFFVLLLTFYICEIYNIYMFFYFMITELLVVIAILTKINDEYLSFKDELYKISIKNRIISEKINLLCNNVVLVHAPFGEKNWSILIIMKVKSRNNKFKLVDNNFIHKYPELGGFYNEIVKQKIENDLYYLIIENPSIRKYELLDLIYKNCAGGTFTARAIEEISKYRK